MNEEEIFKILTRHACEVLQELENHHFKPSDILKDLGANSIDRSEIVMMTLDSLSLKIPLLEIAGARNIGELATILYEKSQSI